MKEVFINIEELNDEDLAITITDEDGIFIDELGDDLLSVSLQELENKLKPTINGKNLYDRIIIEIK